MSAIKIENLTFSYYGYVKPIFENVSFSFDTMVSTKKLCKGDYSHGYCSTIRGFGKRFT